MKCCRGRKAVTHGLVCAAAPAKKHGWVVRTQPSIDTNRTDGNTVQMLCQTWDKPTSNTHVTGGLATQDLQTAQTHSSGLQAQLQASMVERQDRFSGQIQ